MEPWIQTSLGHRFDPTRLYDSPIVIMDIAIALANKCRFNGFCKPFYSVAQHSCLVAELCPPHLKFAGLMHDAAEAYLPDIPSPYKILPEFKAAVALEKRVEHYIWYNFGIDKEMMKEVKHYDNVMLATEAQQLMPSYEEWCFQYETADMKIVPDVPVDAERKFLAMFDKLQRLNSNLKVTDAAH